MPVRQTQFRLYYKEDATDPRLLKRIRPAHEAALAALAERPRSMAELRTILAGAAPRVARRHDAHYLGRHFIATVPLIDVPPTDGPPRYGRSSYVSATDWLGSPPSEASDTQAALAHVAQRYLGAFGPASGEDLAAWLGRRWTQVRPASRRSPTGSFRSPTRPAGSCPTGPTRRGPPPRRLRRRGFSLAGTRSSWATSPSSARASWPPTTTAS